MNDCYFIEGLMRKTHVLHWTCHITKIPGLYHKRIVLFKIGIISFFQKPQEDASACQRQLNQASLGHTRTASSQLPCS